MQTIANMVTNQNRLFPYQIVRTFAESEDLPFFDKRIELPLAHQYQHKPGEYYCSYELRYIHHRVCEQGMEYIRYPISDICPLEGKTE